MFFTITNEKEINIIPASYELTSCEIVIKDKYVLLTFCSKEDIQIINEIRKNPKLVEYLREDPKRRVEYISKIKNI